MDSHAQSMAQTMNYVKQNHRCLACGSANIKTALDLGQQPLANSYKKSPAEELERYPLAVTLCHECYHLQLSHTVDPDIIYKNYLYATGTNQTIQAYSAWFAEFCVEYFGAGATSVLDIGCNDGTQLNYFKNLGLATHGIDPAQNLFEKSQQHHNVVCDFFGPDAVTRLQNHEYDIMSAQNVFAHNPDPLNFLSSCKALMSDRTLLFVQTSQADMVLNNEFDTIYHEHVNFFNANSMNEVCRRADLFLVDVLKTPIHGNSYIFVVSKQNRRPAHVQNILKMEQTHGLLDLTTYQHWRNTVVDNVEVLVKTLVSAKKQGYTLVGYGAAAKGMTLLNFGNIALDFIIDDSSLKQGLYTPGTNCPIVSIEHLKNYKDSDKLMFVPLAWNFFTEIKNRIQTVRNNNNDSFVKYFPAVEVSQ
jgi:2-polyprenyl-3-methyl-5-hydroxy-6-metoxy-1,4-benzoquinol methylase